MLRRLWKRVRIFFVVALVSAAAGATAAGPATSPPQRIVAVGDLHGDYSAWRDIAAAAGIVGQRGGWTGGRTTFVQVGDIVDRGPDSLKILRDLMRLQKEARKAGGKVIVLVGNHEAMNVTGDLRYVDPGEFAAFAGPRSQELRERFYEAKKAEIEAGHKARDPALTPDAIRSAWTRETPAGWVEHRLAWAPDGEIGRWVVRNPAVAMVGGNLFVHGGLSAEYSAVPIDEINRRVAAALKSVERTPGSILTHPLGPLWYRGLITRDPAVTEIAPPAEGAPQRPGIEQELAIVLGAYGAKRIVVGHTPSLEGIQIEHGGRLVRIDSGNASYYGGTPGYLEIIGDRLIPHVVRRSGNRGGGGDQ